MKKLHIVMVATFACFAPMIYSLAWFWIQYSDAGTRVGKYILPDYAKVISLVGIALAFYMLYLINREPSE